MGGKSDHQEFDFLSHFCHPVCSEKKLANYSPWAKNGPPLCFCE